MARGTGRKEDARNMFVLCRNLALKNCIALIGGQLLPLFSAEVENSLMSYRVPQSEVGVRIRSQKGSHK
jgi:hypothetical protein